MKNSFDNKYYKEIMNGKDIEENILRVHSETQEYTRELAERCAVQQRPKLKGGKLEPVISGIKNAYREAGINMKKALQTGQESLYNEADTEKTKKEVAINQAKITKLDGAKQIVEIERKRFNGGKGWKQARWILVIMFTLIGVDALVDFSAFLTMGSNALTSAAYAIGTALVVGVSAHFSRNILALGKNKWQKIAIALIMSAIFFCIFWFIASSRVQVEQVSLALGDQNIKSLGRWGFVAFNMLFWAAASALSFLLPDKEDKMKMAKLRELDDEIASLQSQIAQLEKINADLENALQDKIRMREMTVQFEQKLLDWVESLYLKSVSLFISESSIKRNDGVPDCFEDIDSLPPLFKTQKK